MLIRFAIIVLLALPSLSCTAHTECAAGRYWDSTKNRCASNAVGDLADCVEAFKSEIAETKSGSIEAFVKQVAGGNAEQKSTIARKYQALIDNDTRQRALELCAELSRAKVSKEDQLHAKYAEADGVDPPPLLRARIEDQRDQFVERYLESANLTENGTVLWLSNVFQRLRGATPVYGTRGTIDFVEVVRQLKRENKIEVLEWKPRLFMDLYGDPITMDAKFKILQVY